MASRLHGISQARSGMKAPNRKLVFLVVLCTLCLVLLLVAQTSLTWLKRLSNVEEERTSRYASLNYTSNEHHTNYAKVESDIHRKSPDNPPNTEQHTVDEELSKNPAGHVDIDVKSTRVDETIGQMKPKGKQYRYINKPILQISVLGERNSGTRWTFDHLKQCFGHEIKVTNSFTRYKHWFQLDDSTRYKHDTLVIAQFRNPYDWLKAMERVPHHSPQHLRTMKNADLESRNSDNDWQIFLTKEWTMERVGEDLEVREQARRKGINDESLIPCQEDFTYRDIVSCVKEPLPHSNYNHTIRYSEHQPFYEMRNDGSGLPYANILELRSDKIRNFLSVRKFPNVADVWAVQYEYLLRTGTQNLLRRIQQWTGVVPDCQPHPTQVRQPKKTRFVTPEFAKHVRLHLNWTVEAMIGYNIEWTREDPPREWW